MHRPSLFCRDSISEFMPVVKDYFLDFFIFFLKKPETGRKSTLFR